MRSISLLSFLVFVFAGCGGGSGDSSSSDPIGPSEPDADPTGPLAVTLTSGDDQTGQVTTRLPDPLIVRVTRDGEPVAGHVINFVVATDEGGRAFAGSSATDTDGTAADFWELGTLAGQHTMEVRSVDSSGNPEVWGSFTATAIPGPADSIDFAPELSFGWSGIPGQDLNLDTLIFFPVGDAAVIDLAAISVEAWDQYRNNITNPQPSFTADLPFLVDGSTLTVPEEHIGSIRATLDAARDSVVLLALNDLTDFENFSSSFTCIDGLVTEGTGGRTVLVDSVQVDLTNLLEFHPPGFGNQKLTEMDITVEGTAKAYLSDESVEDGWEALLFTDPYQFPNGLEIVNRRVMTRPEASLDSVVYSLPAVQLDEDFCTFEVRITPPGWDTSNGNAGSSFESHGPVDFVFLP